VYFIGGTLEWLSSFSTSCLIAISVMSASLMFERSPAAAIAIVNEMNAKGPLTKTMLGITVVSDAVLLFCFALTSVFSIAQCSGVGLDADTFLGLGISIAIWIFGGLIMGGVLMFILWIPKIWRAIRGLLLFVVGYMVFWCGRKITSESEENLGYRIAVSLFSKFEHLTHFAQAEPLLICVIAAFIAGNKSSNRREFANILHHTAPFVFIPFFTLAGASINLGKMVSGFAFAGILIGSRMIALFLSTYLAGKYILKQSPTYYLCTWMTLVPQGGTLLGLVQELSTYGSWTG
jgi:Kef-type K+ transport system membrane component KefB